ncbi:MAG: hypothetical protein ACOCRK_00660 [bacterium]
MATINAILKELDKLEPEDVNAPNKIKNLVENLLENIKDLIHLDELKEFVDKIEVHHDDGGEHEDVKTYFDKLFKDLRSNKNDNTADKAIRTLMASVGVLENHHKTNILKYIDTTFGDLWRFYVRFIKPNIRLINGIVGEILLMEFDMPGSISKFSEKKKQAIQVLHALASNYDQLVTKSDKAKDYISVLNTVDYAKLKKGEPSNSSVNFKISGGAKKKKKPRVRSKTKKSKIKMSKPDMAKNLTNSGGPHKKVNNEIEKIRKSISSVYDIVY